MADGKTLWVWQQIYEPQQSPDGWTVHYKDVRANVWKQESFAEHEKAFDFYYKQYRALESYYNVFLRELRINNEK